MLTTVSARQIQREYKKVFEKANKSKEPIIVMSNNKPQGAVIGLDLLEKLRIEEVISQARKEYEAGKTTVIKTQKDLEKHFRKIDKMV